MVCGLPSFSNCPTVIMTLQFRRWRWFVSSVSGLGSQLNALKPVFAPLPPGSITFPPSPVQQSVSPLYAHQQLQGSFYSVASYYQISASYLRRGMLRPTYASKINMLLLLLVKPSCHLDFIPGLGLRGDDSNGE